jgi:hypothetical protein
MRRNGAAGLRRIAQAALAVVRRIGEVLLGIGRLVLVVGPRRHDQAVHAVQVDENADVGMVVEHAPDVPRLGLRKGLVAVIPLADVADVVGDVDVTLALVVILAARRDAPWCGSPRSSRSCG